jgi:hypothetical protein
VCLAVCHAARPGQYKASAAASSAVIVGRSVAPWAIATIDYRVDGVGSCGFLDPDVGADRWIAIADGTCVGGTTRRGVN